MNIPIRQWHTKYDWHWLQKLLRSLSNVNTSSICVFESIHLFLTHDLDSSSCFCCDVTKDTQCFVPSNRSVADSRDCHIFGERAALQQHFFLRMWQLAVTSQSKRLSHLSCLFTSCKYNTDLSFGDAGSPSTPSCNSNIMKFEFCRFKHEFKRCNAIMLFFKWKSNLLVYSESEIPENQDFVFLQVTDFLQNRLIYKQQDIVVTTNNNNSFLEKLVVKVRGGISWTKIGLLGVFTVQNLS